MPFERIRVLNQISQEKIDVVITTVEAIMQNIPTRKMLYNNIVSFKVGEVYHTLNNKKIEKYDLNTLKNILVQLGYERNELVEAQGQFSVRGGMLDIGLTERQGI